MNALLEPLQYAFMRDALLVGSLVAAMCAVLSCFLILKGWSLMGDAISHAVLPGIVLAYIAGLPLSIGAFAAGLTCAVGTGFIKQNSRVKEDTVMGVVFTGLFAFGLVLFSRTPSDMHLDHILVGSILGITREQVWETLGLGGVVLAVTLVLRRDLLLICFDPGQARVLALPERFLNYLLLGLLSLAIVVSLQAVGIILVVAMLVTPGSIAHLWTDRFDRMLVIAVTAAVCSTVAGILISFKMEGSSTSGCIVLVQALVFVISLLFAPKHGIWKRG
ncbi:metal ABC transporter permease [Luteolibacter yonseiensis]|uniref:Metal ABC transporter permease n=1 Tax=Luteolibacter yonseiensis TaxID=1144680 RepID=A0A934R172_9BACT|nr:metal ABC transporter permease [Luteolibacter yonseiensis]MBK1814607.1 metal ABC transporter permease [Luteolibacter yonseiensis]